MLPADDMNRRGNPQPSNRLPESIIRLTEDGLVLGPSTVLAWTKARPGRDLRVPDQEERTLALLSAAYGAVAASDAMGHVRLAAKRWREGDRGRANVHLALSRLGAVGVDSIRRLEVADDLIKAGVEPKAIHRALSSNPASYADMVEKFYNPLESRMPAGNGVASGEWVAGGGGGVTADLTPELLRNLGRFAGRFAGPAIAFGSLFIPDSNQVKVSGSVPSLHNLKYVWNRDETHLLLTYDGDNGTPHSLVAQLNGGVFRDPTGKPVARVLPGQHLAIDIAAISAELIEDREPRLCPVPGPDKPGRQKEKDRDYEDHIKRLINPQNPTPRGFGVQLANPLAGGKLVFYDDCQKNTGVMIEAKGTGYAAMLAKTSTYPRRGVLEKWLKQAQNQVAASGGRPIIWFFAEDAAAEEARKLFEGLPIRIEVEHWHEGMR